MDRSAEPQADASGFDARVAGVADHTKGREFLGRFLKAQRRISGYILTLLPHQADAEDVLQEVSVILWEKFDEQNPPVDFVSWACRVAYLKVQEHRRGQRRQRVIFSDETLDRLAEAGLARAGELRFDERHAMLGQCIGKLGRRDRELLAARYREGATARSAAEGLGRTLDAVYKALARIRGLLHNCVERSLAAEGRL
jgi:RNA polymerase sigma-70 factor (ECF subfamily)